MWSESEVYESIDRSNKETTKYTELPKRQGTSKENQCISMQQILDEADDDDTGYVQDNAEKNECQVRVQMRKDKQLSRPPNKRIGKTSTKIQDTLILRERVWKITYPWPLDRLKKN